MPGKKHMMGYEAGGVVTPAPKITEFDTLQAYVDATLAMDGPPKPKMRGLTPSKPMKPQKMNPSKPQTERTMK